MLGRMTGRGAGVGAVAMLAILLAGCTPVVPSRAPAGSAVPTPRTTAAPTVPPALAIKLTAALRSALEAQGSPGAQAAIVFADGSTWMDAAGESAAGEAMTSELLMPLASVSKVYTAALVLRLADYGVLGLDDPLTKWVPDAVNANDVTIRQLLTHTSGVASDDPALPSVCAPGTCYSYSNSGYGELGQVIEVATGLSYAASLRSRYLTPLGLAATFYPREEAAIGKEATGHAGDDAVLAVDAATQPDGPGWRGASGGLVATAEDAVRFYDALFTGGPLSDAGRAAITDLTPTLGLPGTTECNAAAMLGRRGGPYGESWASGGNAGSFRSWVEHLPTRGLTVAVLVNSNAFPGSIADALEAAALEGAPSATTDGRCEEAIAVRSRDGTVRRLPDTRGFDGMPAWSPDGGSIAWLAFHSDRADILVARADGTAVRHLTDDAANDLRVSWSPDGSRIVYSSDVDGDHELYVKRLADGSITRLTDNDVDDWLPAWSPDGRSIAYIRTEDRGHLRVMAADGSSDREVDGVGDSPWWPAWSPDGGRIAYETGGEIFIVAAAGGQPVRLAVQQLRVVRFPAWAPGADLVFASDGDLYAAGADGSNVRRLTSTPTEESTPAWAPDGATLAFEVSSWVVGTP